MIFDWYKPKSIRTVTTKDSYEYEYSEKPYYDKEHRETMAIIEDIMVKLDEIKLLVEEMKKDEDNKNV